MLLRHAELAATGFSRRRTGRSTIGKIVILLSALCLAACETAPDSLSAPSLSQIKTVGVISLLGDALEYEQLSLTVITTGTFTYPAAEFAIDRFTADCVAKNLKQRFDVRPVRFNPSDFAFDKIVLADQPGSFDSGQPIGAVIKAKATPNNLDAYIIVTKGGGPVKTGASLSQSGVGMLRQHRLLYHDYFVHAIYHLTVVDGHTSKVVARTSSPIWGSEEVDETYWPFDSDNIAVDQARRVADLGKKAINDSMPDGLKSLNLLPQ